MLIEPGQGGVQAVLGSGAVEATCKSLAAIRMKRAGARWKSRDRWEPAITAALKPLAKSVRVAPAPLRKRAA